MQPVSWDNHHPSLLLTHSLLLESQGCKHKQHAASKSSKISKPIRKKPAAKSPAAKSPAADKLKKLNALKVSDTLYLYC